MVRRLSREIVTKLSTESFRENRRDGCLPARYDALGVTSGNGGTANMVKRRKWKPVRRQAEAGWLGRSERGWEGDGEKRGCGRESSVNVARQECIRVLDVDITLLARGRGGYLRSFDAIRVIIIDALPPLQGRKREKRRKCILRLFHCYQSLEASVSIVEGRDASAMRRRRARTGRFLRDGWLGCKLLSRAHKQELARSRSVFVGERPVTRVLI